MPAVLRVSAVHLLRVFGDKRGVAAYADCVQCGIEPHTCSFEIFVMQTFDIRGPTWASFTWCPYGAAYHSKWFRPR